MKRILGNLGDNFNERYRSIGEPAMRRAEERVIGADYGATSYTTSTQADRLADLLQLRPGRILLDIGSGAGWPGIYLARSTGSQVVLTDQPLEGLRAAAKRMRLEEVDGHVVGAGGSLLPLRDNVVDSATSSDVLC